MFKSENFSLTLEIVIGVTSILNLSLNLNLVLLEIIFLTQYWPVPASLSIDLSPSLSAPNVKDVQALDPLERVERPLFLPQPEFVHPELSGLP
jgi:hypothetical protein